MIRKEKHIYDLKNGFGRKMREYVWNSLEGRARYKKNIEGTV